MSECVVGREVRSINIRGEEATLGWGARVEIIMWL